MWKGQTALCEPTKTARTAPFQAHKEKEEERKSKERKQQA